MSSSSQLALHHLRFAYEPAAWALEIPALAFGGEPICAIVGPNGSGKSTLLKVAAGLLVPGAGMVELNGRPVAKMRRPALARRLGYLPQECPALFDYTVAQVAAMGRHAHGGVLEMSNPGDRDAVARALAEVGLDTMRSRPLSHLSGGERRRVWLASALAQEPEILLLDEPTQSLDLHHAAAVMNILARRAARGLRVIAVLHDLHLAALFCDRMILLHDGKIAADGVPDRILNANTLVTVYGANIEVLRHPETQKMLVLAKK
ncbi:MAG: ABC transporter ATP-binding protein [Kiritimatiellae bacterium]|jgi:iron complex transport system ATP-binding protein|nr:ABC transporter ATP-binding protein [Kiritimatiellia bacterium]NLD89753.1 ABC transporter ATP-binding protein [Lentisphaerota bacterium]HPC19023.1 ABC transporter ATP-binding protein [Kiritimatiellia bacterium]HQN80730.1 ABC transporter ATP-binding protein [Kiritimatiellia bacterium]